MECKTIKYTNHAIEFMAMRGISEEEVENAIHNGKVIENYSDDKPYPSKLFFSLVNDRPIHIVLAADDTAKTCFVITVYEPNLEKFEPDFITRKKKA